MSSVTDKAMAQAMAMVKADTAARKQAPSTSKQKKPQTQAPRKSSKPQQVVMQSGSVVASSVKSQVCNELDSNNTIVMFVTGDF